MRNIISSSCKLGFVIVIEFVFLCTALIIIVHDTCVLELCATVQHSIISYHFALFMFVSKICFYPKVLALVVSRKIALQPKRVQRINRCALARPAPAINSSLILLCMLLRGASSRVCVAPYTVVLNRNGVFRQLGVVLFRRVLQVNCCFHHNCVQLFPCRADCYPFQRSSSTGTPPVPADPKSE